MTAFEIPRLRANRPRSVLTLPVDDEGGRASPVS